MSIVRYLLDVISLASNVITISLFVGTSQKPISKNLITNRYFKPVVISLVATILVFTIPIFFSNGNTNIGNIDGSGNHIVNGANNGINGDVTIGIVPRHLDAASKGRLVTRINDSLIDHSIDKTTEITIGWSAGNEEAMNFALEVANFLGSQGYNINRNVGPTLGNEGKGFWINYNDKKLFIDVGVASHNGNP